MYSIYKITKPNSNGIYIGRTKQKLKNRLYHHRGASKQTKNKNLKVYQWFDKTCQIELIELTDNKERETEIIKQYVENPNYEVMNMYVGGITDTPEYRKMYYETNIEKIKEFHKQPEMLEKKNHYQKTSQHAKKYRSEYYKWYYKAKKLGMTVEEYKKSLNNGN